MRPALQIPIGTTRRIVISWADYLAAEEASIGGSVAITGVAATATGDLALGDVDSTDTTGIVWITTDDMAADSSSVVTVTMETDAGHVEVYAFTVLARTP